MNHQEKINKYIQTQVNDFIQKISSSYSIEQDELLLLWNDKAKVKRRPSNTMEVKPREVKPRCTYIFKRGERKNKACGKIIKKGKLCCSEHDKFLITDIENTPYKLHNKTNLVLHNKKVIGKYDGKNILDLSSDDVELALSYSFKIGVSLSEEQEPLVPSPTD